MKRPCYVVDSFSPRPLAGNSAGVVLDASDLATAELQRIAGELKHAETAFPLPAREPQAAFHLRWFTPFTEVRFCGHATLATLHVLDKRDGLPHNPERHEQAKVRRTIEHTPVELVGFHSRDHRGIFTPKESNVHVHLRTEDGRISGHLEAIRLAPGARLAVPASGFDR